MMPCSSSTSPIDLGALAGFDRDEQRLAGSGSCCRAHGRAVAVGRRRPASSYMNQAEPRWRRRRRRQRDRARAVRLTSGAPARRCTTGGCWRPQGRRCALAPRAPPPTSRRPRRQSPTTASRPGRRPAARCAARAHRRSGGSAAPARPRRRRTAAAGRRRSPPPRARARASAMRSRSVSRDVVLDDGERHGERTVARGDADALLAVVDADQDAGCHGGQDSGRAAAYFGCGPM